MFSKFKESALELKSVKNLSLISFLVVVKILISSLRLVVTPGVQISFGFLVYIIVGSLFGPFSAIVFGVLTYILSFVGGTSMFFHLGFLLSAVVSCFIYAVFLYKGKFSFKRVVAATIVHDLVVHFFLNIIWLSQLFHNNNFLTAFITRLPKGLIMLPINCVLSFFVVVIFKKLYKVLNLVFG